MPPLTRKQVRALGQVPPAEHSLLCSGCEEDLGPCFEPACDERFDHGSLDGEDYCPTCAPAPNPEDEWIQIG